MAEKKIRELKDTARRVFLDSSSPSIATVVRTTVIVLLILSLWGFLGSVLISVTKLAFLIVLAVFLAYLLNPLVHIIRRPFQERHLEKFMPRGLAIVIAYLLVFVVLGLAITAIAPRIAEQARQLASNVPTYTASIQTWVKDVSNRYERYKIPEQIQEEVNVKISSVLGEIGTSLTAFVGELLLNIVTYLPWLILIPIFSFFFLKDANMFRVSLLRLFPGGTWRFRAESFLNDVNNTLAAYTKAQIISCFLIGTICTIGFYLLDLNYALLLGILAGILEFIPLIGPLTIAITAITIGAFYSTSQAVYVAIFLIVLRLLQDYVFYPRIVREGIHLHPMAIILSVLAGEQIAGITGVFLSIPVIALATVLLKHIREHRGSKGIVADIIEEVNGGDEAEPLAE